MSETTDIQPTEQPIPDKIGLTVDSALVYRLGHELVGLAETVVSELVKNAYDADARRVTASGIRLYRNGFRVLPTVNSRTIGLT